MNNRRQQNERQFIDKKIIIAERDNIAALTENKKVTDFFIQRGDVLLGDVYLASVDNILPSIDAAFVNVGTDKMGFLHAEDVMGKGTLKEKLSPKQKLVVQVVKEPTGHKGPRVTTEISLPGRFLVLMPYEPGVSVSKKIENSRERARLKAIINLIKPVGVGVIIRTEAEGQTESDIQEDLEILLEKWNNIITSSETLEAPSLIYRDQDLLYKVIREACTEDVSEVVVDTPFALNRVQNILQNWHMNNGVKVTLYKGTDPLLVAMDIHKEIKAALNVKVNMPSGGYLFIQQTEALTVIDVNSGKFVSSSTQDETILKTNIEAVHEIARQLRLRNIGGMVIVDFIDMTSRADKLAMLEELEIALEADKAKPQVGQLSDLGLVELTRHRQGQSLAEIFTKKCPHCQGSGCSIIDFNFATPVAEGEYRAKAAKVKLPSGAFKKNNKFNVKQQNNNLTQGQITEQETEQTEKTVIETEPSVNAANAQDSRKESNRKNKRNKFDRNKKSSTPVENSGEASIHASIDEESNNEAVQTEEPKKKPAKKGRKTTKKAEKEVVSNEISEVKAESVEEPKKSKRPNRGSAKKTRTTKKKAESEE